MQRLTLRGSTIIGVSLIGLSFILLSSLAGNFFRQAAVDAQVASLSRIIEVASREVLRALQHHAINLGASLNSDNQLARALQQAAGGASAESLLAILDDPFLTGFVGAPDVELRKLRIYDLALRPLYQSRHGDGQLPFHLPPTLHTTASRRSGAERLKAVSGLWLSSSGPLYSVLIPIGGLRISGYIEVIFDPKFTLEGVSEITSMPVSIHRPEERYSPTLSDGQKKVVLPIEYTLYGDDGQPAYRMVGLEDIDKFNQEMLHTQWLTVIGFLTLIFGILLLALWLLRIGLFSPLRDLMRGIEEYSQGRLDTTIQPGGLQEIHTLGNTFNQMLQRIRDDIRELERYSTTDGLTGIPNRRYFDQCLEHETSHARRHASPLALLYIDIDYFKPFNDHYGHLRGDEALIKVAHCIATMARRDTDVAARLGGEEFAILLPDTLAENARLVAEALRLAVAHLEIGHERSKVADHLTLSIGVATLIPEVDTRANELLARADQALYRAKSEGRNRVIVAR